MPHELIVFTNPQNAIVQLIHDSGFTAVATPAVHASGRPGQGITIPDSVPNSNGCRVIISAEGKVTVEQRSLLMYNQEYAYLLTDDFVLQDVAGESVEPPKPDIDTSDPAAIINWTYTSGSFDLSTHEGCGKFTEECCKNLHEMNNEMWGHFRKNPGQNQYNGHAVDAVQCLAGPFVGGWDIIHDSVSPSASPAFNHAGPPAPEAWYYPA